MKAFGRLGCLLIIAGLVLCIGRYAFFPPKCVREVSGATYAAFVEQVRETTVPSTARDLHFVWCSVGMGGRAHAYRFTAPVEDLKAYAINELKAYSREGAARAPAFIPLTDRVTRPNLSAYGVHDLSWFDVENIEEGFTLTRDGATEPFFWIDPRREILYSWWTD